MAFKAIKNCPLLALVRSAEISSQLLARWLHFPQKVEQSEGSLNSSSDNNHLVMSDQGPGQPWQEHREHLGRSTQLMEHWAVPSTHPPSATGCRSSSDGWAPHRELYQEIQPNILVGPGIASYQSPSTALSWSVTLHPAPSLSLFEVICSLQSSSTRDHVITP